MASVDIDSPVQVNLAHYIDQISAELSQCETLLDKILGAEPEDTTTGRDEGLLADVRILQDKAFHVRSRLTSLESTLGRAV